MGNGPRPRGNLSGTPVSERIPATAFTAPPATSATAPLPLAEGSAVTARGAPALNPNEALELLDQLKAALRQVRMLRAAGNVNETGTRF